MIDLNFLKNCQITLRKMYLEKNKGQTNEDFDSLVKSYYLEVFSKEYDNETSNLFAKTAFEDFTHSLQDVVDVDFDKEVKSLAKVLEKTQSSI